MPKDKPDVPREDKPGVLIDTERMAEILGVKPNTLEVWRSTQRFALPFVKVGRCVRYSKPEVMRFLQANPKCKP